MSHENKPEPGVVLQFPQIRARRVEFQQELRDLIQRYSPNFYTPQGQAEARRAWGKLTW
jgi:hypothetical protein